MEFQALNNTTLGAKPFVFNFTPILKKPAEETPEKDVVNTVDIAPTEFETKTVTTDEVKPEAKPIEEKSTTEDAIPVVESVEEKQIAVEETVEEKPATETVEEKTEETTVEIPENTVAPQEEESKEEAPAPKKKRKRRTKAEIEAAHTEEEKQEEVVEEISHQMTGNYDEHMCLICYPIKDEKWDNLKDTIENELSKIKIPANLNPATLLVLTEQVNMAYDMIAKYYFEYLGGYNALYNKDNGELAYAKTLNQSGSNADERKKKALHACESYHIGSETLNLHLMARITAVRYSYLTGAFKRIENKKDMLKMVASALRSAQ